eukprot:2645261-Pyramimonas_sp.AAC.1
MELQIWLAPRALKDRSWVSHTVQAQRGTVAGSLDGGRMAKAFLGPIMERAHQRYGMQILLRTFVDHAGVRVEGTAKQTTSLTIESGAMGCDQLRQAGLVISEKTTV